MWQRATGLRVQSVAGLAALSWTLAAEAQAPGPSAPAAAPPPQPAASAGRRPLPATRKRALPDYDGRRDASNAGDALIWIPRIAFSPLYLVSEFGLRRPFGWLISTAERKRWPALLLDFFTWGPERNAGIFPTGLIDFGFKPSVGLYFFWDDFLARDNKLRARAATWGPDWLKFSVADRLEFQPGHEIGLRAEFLKRPDWVFHGIGPDTLGEDRGRFHGTFLDGGFGYDARPWRMISAHAFVGVRHASFQAAEGCCGNPTVAERIAQGRYLEPVGIADGYTVFQQSLEFTFDNRPARPLSAPKDKREFQLPPGSGVRVDLRGEHAGSMVESRPLAQAAPVRYEWVRYGATLGAFLDITGQQRVLGLSLIADFADPLIDRSGPSATPIPFTEQVSLGGFRPMRGYLTRRLVDRSAAVAVLEYQWPVWVWLDGALHYSVGNVFGEHLEGFATRRLRSSVGIGLRSTTARDHPFELLVAVGTRTFEQGSGIDHVRFVLGATNGF
jgi:hypothetical protein